LRALFDPGRRLRGQIERLALEPSGGKVRRLYRVVARVQNPEDTLRPGMTGVARFDAGRVPAAVHLWGRVAAVLRINFWV